MWCELDPWRPSRNDFDWVNVFLDVMKNTNFSLAAQGVTVTEFGPGLGAGAPKATPGALLLPVNVFCERVTMPFMFGKCQYLNRFPQILPKVRPNPGGRHIL